MYESGPCPSVSTLTYARAVASRSLQRSRCAHSRQSTVPTINLRNECAGDSEADGPGGGPSWAGAVHVRTPVATAASSADRAAACLENPVDVNALVALSLRLLDVQLRLLRHCQRDVLLGRRARARPDLLERRRARQDLDREAARLHHEHERVVLARELAEAQPRHDAVELRTAALRVAWCSHDDAVERRRPCRGQRRSVARGEQAMLTTVEGTTGE